MKKQVLIQFILILTVNFLSFGQSVFEKLYAPYTNKSHTGQSIVQSYQSGYIITGMLNEIPWNQSLLLMKINPDGDVIWTKNYGLNNDAMGNCIQRTQDSCYIVCGRAESIFQSYILKINEDGDTLWTKKYKLNDSYTSTSSIYPTDDGGFILTGFISSYPAGSFWLLIKIDQNGDLLWYKKHGDPNYHENNGTSIQETSDHGFIIAGVNERTNGDSAKAFLSKTDSQGNLIWTKFLQSDIVSHAYSVKQASDGGYIWGGRFNGHACVLRTDAKGDTLWNNQILPSSSTTYSIFPDSDSTILCCGTYYTTTYQGVFLLKVNYTGEINWSQLYTSGAYRYGYEVKETAEGGYIIIGDKSTYGSSLDSIYIIKTNENGVVSGNDCQLIASGKSVKVFPNPNNGDFWIESPDDYDQIEIFDHLNRKIYIESYTVQGCSRKSIRLHGQPPGLYFLKLRNAGKGIIIHKFILW